MICLPTDDESTVLLEFVSGATFPALQCWPPQTRQPVHHYCVNIGVVGCHFDIYDNLSSCVIFFCCDDDFRCGSNEGFQLAVHTCRLMGLGRCPMRWSCHIERGEVGQVWFVETEHCGIFNFCLYNPYQRYVPFLVWGSISLVFLSDHFELKGVMMSEEGGRFMCNVETCIGFYVHHSKM